MLVFEAVVRGDSLAIREFLAATVFDTAPHMLSHFSLGDKDGACLSHISALAVMMTLNYFMICVQHSAKCTSDPK